MTPVQQAADHLEYVLRHGGTKHLQPAVVDIPWYQYFLLDVMIFLVVIVAVVLIIVISIVKWMVRFCCKKVKTDWNYTLLVSISEKIFALKFREYSNLPAIKPANRLAVYTRDFVSDKIAEKSQLRVAWHCAVLACVDFPECHVIYIKDMWKYAFKLVTTVI